jgi:hypothetical protein
MPALCGPCMPNTSDSILFTLWLLCTSGKKVHYKFVFLVYNANFSCLKIYFFF